MEYTYEFLRNCHGLRFRATICNKPQEGVIKVTSEGVMLCYGEEDPGYLVTFGRRDTLSFSEQTFSILPNDFEILPRDPESYKDWQVGDVICGCHGKNEIIFRSGEVVVFKYTDDNASNIFTCLELFESGWRLILTDIEKRIIEEKKKKAEWKPQDGDVCYLSRNGEWIFIKKDGRVLAECYIAFSIDRNSLYYNGIVAMPYIEEELRLATDAEKQRLFDALAKNGKRWNAEKKVVEDIEPEKNDKPASEHTFKKFDPVLVRDSDGEPWRLGVFDSMRYKDNSVYKYTLMGCIPYAQCIPLNEKTEHLLGTTEDYKEEQP